MRWPAARPRVRKLKNYAACSTSTKGTGDDDDDRDYGSHKLALAKHDACAGLDPAAFSLARHGLGGPGRSTHGARPASVDSLRVGRWDSRPHARRTRRYVFLDQKHHCSGFRWLLLGERARVCEDSIDSRDRQWYSDHAVLTQDRFAQRSPVAG